MVMVLLIIEKAYLAENRMQELALSITILLYLAAFAMLKDSPYDC